MTKHRDGLLIITLEGKPGMLSESTRVAIRKKYGTSPSHRVPNPLLSAVAASEYRGARVVTFLCSMSEPARGSSRPRLIAIQRETMHRFSEAGPGIDRMSVESFA